MTVQRHSSPSLGFLNLKEGVYYMSKTQTVSIIRYEFSAVCLPSHKVTLFVTIEGLSPSLIAAQTAAIRQDVLQCFTHGGFPGVAMMLESVPSHWMGSDTLSFRGTRQQQRRIFHALAAYPYKTDESTMDELGGPSPDPIPEATFPYAMPSEAVLSVSVEFFRTHCPPYLMVQLHHGAVQSWHVDAMPPHVLDM